MFHLSAIFSHISKTTYDMNQSQTYKSEHPVGNTWLTQDLLLQRWISAARREAKAIYDQAPHLYRITHTSGSQITL